MIDTPFELLNEQTAYPPPSKGGVGGGSLGVGLYACILADGDFPTASIPLQLLRNAGVVCCCDGAARHWPAADAIVGDGDSCPPELRHRLHQVDEQEDNDLTKATRYCIGQGYRRIAYLGATGRREDHTLGNISLLVRYEQTFGIEPLMATDHGWFTPARGTTRFRSFPRQQVSLFNFGCTRFSTHGLRYDGYPYQQWWQGTLNEALADSFLIEADGPYLVFRTYQAK